MEYKKPQTQKILYLDIYPVVDWMRQEFPELFLANDSFVDWFTSYYELTNGSYHSLAQDYANPDSLMSGDKWVAPIIQKIFEEFPDCRDKYGDIYLHVSW